MSVRLTPLVVGLVLLAQGCPEEGEPDAGPGKDLAGDLLRTDAPLKDQAVTATDGKADKGQAQGDAFKPTDLGFSCAGCLLEEVCVHTVNSQTCKVTKSQCKYRTPACFSPTTNPCCLCEAQVCGLWGTCTRPPACAAPPAGSYNPKTECFCYSK